jgi:hypothetical protein
MCRKREIGSASICFMSFNGLHFDSFDASKLMHKMPLDVTPRPLIEPPGISARCRFETRHEETLIARALFGLADKSRQDDEASVGNT